MVRLLTLDAPFDLPTTYLSAWMEKFIGEARLLGAEVLSLRGFVSEADLAGALQSFNPEIVVMGGHGNSNTFTTEGLVPLLIACTNDQVLSGRETLVFSCLTGNQLVPSIVSKSGLAAGGFTAEFVWVVDPSVPPSQDPFARPFERLFVEPSLELVKGNGFAGWYSKFQSVALEEERAWSQSTDPLAAQVVLSLIQDRRAATWFGEGGGVSAGGGAIPLVLLLGLLSG